VWRCTYCLSPVRVHVVDPSAYTPPYDHALCSALAALNTEVELFTSRFAYGPVAPPAGYARRELFYRAAPGAPGSRLRMATKLLQHAPDMLRYRRAARTADVIHFQWLPVQHLDRFLLPRGTPRARAYARATPPSLPGEGSVRGAAPERGPRARARPPLVLTAHDVLPREPRPGQLAAQRRLYDRFDAVVVHSEHGRLRLIEELSVHPDRVHVIPHGAFAHLVPPGAPTHLVAPTPQDPPASPSFQPPPRFPAPASSSLQPPPRFPAPPHTDKPVVLMFGLMRPYKGIDVLLRAWRGFEGEQPIDDAELWIAGMPRMDISTLRATAPANVRFHPHFVTDQELPAYFARASLVVLPYLQADQSGVLFTALAFGKPLLLSDVGGFPEVASTGAARVVPAGDARALRHALRRLLDDRAALTEMCVKARAAATGRYSWEAIARAHVALYERLLTHAPRR
jgi:glycosyltransferase involved in cell wall biosynthesis